MLKRYGEPEVAIDERIYKTAGEDVLGLGRRIDNCNPTPGRVATPNPQVYTLVIPKLPYRLPSPLSADIDLGVARGS